MICPFFFQRRVLWDVPEIIPSYRLYCVHATRRGNHDTFTNCSLVSACLTNRILTSIYLSAQCCCTRPPRDQPYPNGQLPNLTIRKEMLAVVLMLPVQVDHLKRSGIGRVVMGLLKCKEVWHELSHVWRTVIAALAPPYVIFGMSALQIQIFLELYCPVLPFDSEASLIGRDNVVA